MAVDVFFFYLAYFTYFAPYQALYPDLVATGASGRAQGIQGVFSNAGFGCVEAITRNRGFSITRNAG
jgi:hypothetical protein